MLALGYGSTFFVDVDKRTILMVTGTDTVTPHARLAGKFFPVNEHFVESLPRYFCLGVVVVAAGMRNGWESRRNPPDYGRVRSDTSAWLVRALAALVGER